MTAETYELLVDARQLADWAMARERTVTIRDADDAARGCAVLHLCRCIQLLADALIEVDPLDEVAEREVEAARN